MAAKDDFNVKEESSGVNTAQAVVPSKSLEEANEESDSLILRGLYTEVQAAKRHFDNYCLLFVFAVYTAIYLAIMFLQARSFQTFQVAQAHVPLLPPDYAEDGGNTFSSSDDVYNWLNNSIIQTIWTNTECGNGICDRPQESPSYGANNRLGCAADCGVFQKITPFSLAISTSFQTSAEQAATSWNLCMKSPMEFCWFQNYQTFTGDLSSYSEMTMNIPDGNWTFRINAPNGGVAVSGSYGSSFSSEDAIWSIGAGCNADSPPSNYTLCRKECDVFVECYQNQCKDTQTATLLANYVSCLTSCGVKSETYNVTQELKGLNCSGKIAKLVGKGSSVCDDLFSEDTILLIDSNFTLPSTVPRTAYKDSLWDKLGSTDENRLFSLSSAVQRALYSWIKDECLVSNPKPLSGGSQLSAFLCTYFGGPTTLEGCTYKSSVSDKILKTDAELFKEIQRIHQNFNIFQDQQNRFTEVLLWAIQSVTLLEDSTVVAFNLRLKQLDDVLVSSPNSGCNKAAQHVPISVNSGTSILYRTIFLGESVQFTWQDDQEHSIVATGDDSDLSIYPEGFGASELYIARNKICTPENIGMGSYSSSPEPCNLVDPSTSPPYSFSYTYLFREVGQWGFQAGRAGDNFDGKIYIYNDTRSSANSSICSPGCVLSSISNGRCDQSCNNPECLFDGGDCSCPVDDYGRQICSCPPGQFRGYSGECCDDTSYGTVTQDFKVSNFTGDGDPAATNADILTDADVALVRTTAKLNRVVVGLLVNLERHKAVQCDSSNTRFTFLQSRCLKGQSEAPYGTTPQTLLSSGLYNKDYLDAVSDIFSKNSSFVNETFAFNSRGIPYGFYPVTIEGKHYGFSYLFDINLNSDDAGKLLSYLKDGFFIDNSTSHVRVKLITYNGEVNLFSLVSVEANVENGGRITVKADVKSLSVEHYKTASDWGRFVLELVFLVFLAVDIFGEIKNYVETVNESKSFFSYFYSLWNYIDILSIGIMIAGVIFWTYDVLHRQEPFKIQARYNIYESLSPFSYWKLQNPPKAFQNAMKVFDVLSEMSDFRGLYFAIQGINVFLMVLRLLKLMDFQPRLGTITRTFAAAAPDLLHFFIVWALIFMSFTFFAHVVFGRLVDQFRTIGAAMNSNFRIIMGQDSAADFLFQLRGWELVAGVIFWWTFISIVVFVVMNVLIAIIVDSYAAIKSVESDLNPKSLPDDIISVFKNLSKAVTPGKFSLRKQLLVLKKLGADQNGNNNKEESSKLVYQIGDNEVEPEELTSLLERAGEGKGVYELGSQNEVKSLAKDVSDNLPVTNLSDQAKDGTDDIKAIKASLARLEEAVSDSRMAQLERTVSRLQNLIESKFNNGS